MSCCKVEIGGVNTTQLKILTNIEMKELFMKLQQGDESAKEILIDGNPKLVLSIVQHFSNRCENMDGLLQVGRIRLAKFTDNFDLKHEVRSSTYTVSMTMGEIKRYLRDNQVVRVFRHLKNLAYRVPKLKKEHIRRHQGEPSVS